MNVYLQTRSAKSSSDLDSVHILVAFIDCGFCPHIRIKQSRWIPLNILKDCIFFFFVLSVQNLSLEWNWFRTSGWVKYLQVSGSAEYTFIFMLGRPMVSPQSQQFSQWDEIYSKGTFLCLFSWSFIRCQIASSKNKSKNSSEIFSNH